MKKGFTLTELLAVVVIIAILIIIMFPSYINTSNDIKNSNLENIKSILSKSMLDHANKYYIDDIKPAVNKCSDETSCCIYFSINFIKEKEIFQTANGNIVNPVTNADLEGYIKVVYNPNKYLLEANYEEEKPVFEDNHCKCVDVRDGQEVMEACYSWKKY